jgi:hypothetical protein
MANAIDLVVAQQALDQLKNLIAQLDLVDAKMTAISANAITLAANAGKVTTPSGGSTNAGGNAGVNSELSAQAALNKKLADSIALLQAKYVELTRVRGNGKKTLLEEQASVRESLRLATLAAKGVNDEVSAYQKLDAEYKKSVAAAKQLGAVHGSTSAIFLKEAASVNKLADELKAIDGKLGNHTRSVGNYASGWNGLSNSINQLTREAPAFANSMQTGFMAISNNIPILVDELISLKKANADVVAGGGQAKSMFKSVATAIFSWQTALSLGVTLLTIYGKDLIDLAFGLSAAEKAQKAFKDSMTEANVTTTDYSTNLIVLNEIIRDSSLSSEERNLALKDLAKIIPEVSGLDLEHAGVLDQITFLTHEYVQAQLIRTKADLLVSQITTDQLELDKRQAMSSAERLTWYQKVYLGALRLTGQGKKGVQVLKEVMINEDSLAKQNIERKTDEVVALETLYGNYRSKYKGLADDFGKSTASSEKKLESDRLRKIEEARKKEYEADISNLERKKEIVSDELNAFRGGVNERIQISTKLALAERNIIERKYKEAVRLAEGNDDLLVVSANDQITALENTITDNAKRIAGFYKDVFNEAKDAFPDTVFGDKYKMTQQQKDDLKEHDRRVKEVADSMSNYLSSFVSDFGSSSGLTETMNILSGEIAGFGKDFSVTFNAIAEAGQEVFNKISQASQANFEGEYKRLEAQKEIALKFAGESDFAKERIEMQAEERRKEIANREFKAKQKMAIFNIAIDTAQAIVSTYAQVPKFDFGISATALAIAIGGIGAVQIAAVAAQKVPQYFEGGTHDGGLMIVNDAKGSNYKETIVTPDGKIIKPEGRDVLMNAPKGTQIFTPEQWQEKELHNMLQSKGISMNESYHNNSGLTYQEMDAILGKHFKNITTQTTTFDKKGFSSYSVSKGNKTIRNENRASGQGFKV